ncbi:MAG: GNAT family N-acetyltransferase [Alphaproteobacteria bacterium]
MRIERLERDEAETAVRAVLATLPDWFGIEKSNEDYAKAAHILPCFGAVDAAGVVQGVALLSPAEFSHWCNVPSVGAAFEGEGFVEAESVELHLLAVRPDHHRDGIGSALLAELEAEAKAHKANHLFVLTLGPSEPYEPYQRTRAFYAARGFRPIVETPEIWGPTDPCLISVKTL